MGYASTGALPIWGFYDASTRENFVVGTTYFCLKAGWHLAAELHARVSHLFTSVTNGSGIVIGGVAYTWRSVLNQATPREVQLGGSLAISLANMVAAITVGAGSGVKYSSATVDPHPTLGAEFDGVATLAFIANAAGPRGSGINTEFGVTIGGGYRLRGEAPQFQSNGSELLTIYLEILDNQRSNGSNLQASVLMRSLEDPTITTRERLIRVAEGLEQRIVADRCQLWTYREGVEVDPFGSVVCGGIPWRPPTGVACNGEVIAVDCDEIAWLSGDHGNEMSPRTAVATLSRIKIEDETTYDSGNAGSQDRWDQSDAIFNGVLTPTLPTGFVGQFRFVALTPSNSYLLLGGSTGKLINSPLWHDEQPMLLEPVMVWGDTGNDDPTQRGQTYNSWIQTRQYNPVQDTIRDEANQVLQPFTMFGVEGYFLPFTFLNKWGSIMLLVPDVEPEPLVGAGNKVFS